MSTILNAIEAYEGQSLSELQADRALALDYYLGKPLPGDSAIPDGRSRVVSRDVADSIEWIKPGLLRIFTSGDDVVAFSPQGQEDIDGAQQETDFVNHVITEKNSWFTTAYQWFTDALTVKNGYVKAWYDESEEINKETYKSLPEDQAFLLLQDPEVEVVESSAYPNPYAPLQMQMGPDGQPVMGPPPMLYDMTVQKKKTYGCAKYMALPPERTIIDTDHAEVDLWNCNFVEHWEYKTISSLREQGFDVPDDIGDETGSTDTDIEAQARDQHAQTINADEDNPDKSMRKVKVRECWIRYDADDDGKAELHHVFVVGKTPLLDEPADFIPVACVTPRIMPHRHIGLSEADVTIDIQNIKSALQRGLLDNVYFGINGRNGVDKDRVNLDDMLTSRPGGIVRTEGPPSASIMPLTHQAQFQPVLVALEYFDSVREGRTGSSKSAQQISPDALSKIPSGIAIAQIQSAQQAIVELIARVFAETGVKSLFRIVHAITLKNARQSEVVRLRNKWVTVDPRQWKTRNDMTISVGLGSGNREQQAVALERLLGMQGNMIPLGLANAKTLHHTASKLTQAMGFKDTEAFWVSPDEAKPMQPPQQPVDQLKVAELQLKAKSDEGDLKVKAFDAQTKRLQVVAGARKDQADNEIGKATLAAAQKPGDETAAMRQEVSGAANESAQALIQLANVMTQQLQQMQQMIVILASAANRRTVRVPVRDPKTREIIRVDEVPAEAQV